MVKYDFNLENIKKGIRHPQRVFDELVLEYTYRLPLTVLNSERTIGTNVYERDWDVLIILDTCRVDALQEIADEYEFLRNIGSIYSTGGASGEWVARTFDESHQSEISKTAYLTANAHAQMVLEDKVQLTDSNKHLTFKSLRRMPTVDIGDLAYCEYLFQYERWGVEGPRGHLKGMTPPRYVTDRAVTLDREAEYDRTILHYFQPHSPWVSNALDEDRGLHRYEDDWWGYLTETDDLEKVWKAYLDELRYALDDVELLLRNLDAEKVVITADHGEAFGEYGVLGHKIGSIHPKVRKVPWVETTATDLNTYSPSTAPPNGDTSMSTSSVTEQLEALGYKT